MKQKLTVNGRTYEVQIEDIHARPVVVYVDGHRFEVMPGEQDQAERGKEAGGSTGGKPFRSGPISASSPSPAANGNTLTAPLPGTIASILVKPGDHVEAGQVIVVIEAMKMKNSIRSTSSGAIREVLVSEGQSVSHKQALIRFADPGEATKA
jgi:biotin carboxyl carrier protein